MKFIKKSFSFFICIFVILSATVNVFAAESEPTVSFQSQYDSDTGILLLTVEIDNAEDCNGFSLVISYPKNDVVYEKYTPQTGSGGLSEKGDSIVCSHSQEADYSSATVKVGVFQFRVFDGCESAEFSLKDSFVIRNNENITVSGKTVADFTDFVAIIGDTDCNGKITVADARLILRIVAKLETENEKNIQCGDVNYDGKLTVTDARKILRVIAKLDTFDISENHIHTIEVDAAVASTCTETGLTEGSHCKTCGKIIVAQKTTQALGHNFVDGICTRCGKSESVQLTPQEIYKKAQEYSVEVSAVTSAGTLLGTGFFISDDGQLVTNFHVIDGARTITVKTFDGTEYDVKKVISYNSKYDIAVLKIEAECVSAVLNKNIPTTGDTVYTLGSSQGLTETFTNGIVSSADRTVESYSADMSYIQVTAPITNGNSGGPLINSNGEVIGITTWGITTGQNMNFAISVKYLDMLDNTNPLTVTEFNNYCNGKGTITVENSSYTVQKGETVKVKVSYKGFNPYSLVANGSTRFLDIEWDTQEYGNTYEGYFYLNITATGYNVFMNSFNFEVYSSDNYSTKQSFKINITN